VKSRNPTREDAGGDAQLGDGWVVFVDLAQRVRGQAGDDQPHTLLDVHAGIGGQAPDVQREEIAGARPGR